MGEDLGRPMNPMMPMDVKKLDERPNVDIPVATKEPKLFRRWDPVDSRQNGDKGQQVEKPMAIAEPHLGQDEENQVDMGIIQILRKMVY